MDFLFRREYPDINPIRKNPRTSGNISLLFSAVKIRINRSGKNKRKILFQPKRKKRSVELIIKISPTAKISIS